MPTKSTLNRNLAKVSDISWCSPIANASEHFQSSNPILNAINGLANEPIWYEYISTGNSDKYYAKIGFKQPKNPVNPYQIQYRVHSRYTPAQAKKKGAEWTGITKWKAFLPVTNSIKKGSEVVCDTWMTPNVGINRSSSYVVCGEVSGTFDANYDAHSYQFRVRTYNIKTYKHGPWVTSSWLKIYKAPRVGDLTLFAADDGSLLVKCNIRYADRGGTFTFKQIYDNGSAGSGSSRVNHRSLLKAASFSVKMINDTSRTVNSRPRKRDDMVPASCRIPVSSLKRAIKPGEYLWLGAANVFVSNETKGYAPLTKNVTGNPTKGIGSVTHTRIQVDTRDITINRPRLVLKHEPKRALLLAYLYKSDANDVIDKNAVATLTYKYNGKLYTVKPAYSKLTLSETTTTKPIAYWIFASCPLGTPLAVKAVVSNTYGSKGEASAKKTLPSQYWYLQKEGDLKCGGILQWNVNVRTRSSSKVTLELPYGREKPFVAYGKGVVKSFDVSGEVPTKTQHYLFIKEYATFSAWKKVQENPGVYLLRGPNAQMYRLAITEVSLETDDKTEILKVSFSGTEIA